MSENILERVDFGHIDAEADPNLIRYFLETDSYKRIFNGDKMYVIGRKGTGKSAIYLTIEGIKNPDILVSGLSFDYYPWHIHNIIKDETKSIDFAHVNTWKYIILLELAKLVIKEQRDDSPELNEIKEYLQNIYGSLNPNFKEYLVDKIKRIKCIEFPKLSWKELSGGKFEFEEKDRPESKLVSSINIVNNVLKDKLFKLLSPSKLYFIMFDKLDDGWDDTLEFKSSIVGLLRASRDLNHECRKHNKMLRCIPFLRSDIYDCLQYNDKNKAFSDIEFLYWGPDNLKNIINKRISNSAGIRESNAWDMIFDNKVLIRKTTNFNYIVKRTLLRPRDIIQFCDCCKINAIKHGRNKILSEDIYSGENAYSEYIFKEFLDEALKQCTYIEHLFEILRSLRYERFSFEDFEKEYDKVKPIKTVIALDPNTALKILFDFSIIGIERVGGSGGGSSFEFKYTDPFIQPDFKRLMIVHPSLKKHLKLTEKRTKAEEL